MSEVHRYGSFVIQEEGSNLVAVNTDGVDDGAFLEIQSDSYDTLIAALKQVYAAGEHYDPRTREFGPMPTWLEPFIKDGDPTRVVLPSRDLRRVFGLTKVKDRGNVISLLVGASVAAAIWSVVSCSTIEGLRVIGVTAAGLL